ncbi:MAG: adenylate/guanylate cyclase domain-containing protein [Candidatus Limnocylindrales bacterium]
MTEERRLVTILFADVIGSTALGESLDPEELRALLTRYYGHARDVVGEYGGTLEKFIGDAVMAVFGLPVAHGDDAERALGAAIDLRDRVRDDPRLGDRLPIRLGVASGDIVARRDAAAGDDFMVTGDAVNVAARLQQGADPWAIQVTDRTARAARGFKFGPLAELEARGKARPVPARRLIGRGREQRARLPMIGRDADLAQLELVARRVFTERRPFLVTVVAPAGTGKTRLVEALLERLPALGPASAVAIAQCLPYGQRLTYWPLRAVLQHLVGTDDAASPDEFRHAVGSWLRAQAVDDAEAVGRALLATVGAADLEVVDRAALFGAWRTALEAAATAGPLTLILEDLHWSSDSLLDLLDSLVQPRADLPILIVAIARPELLDRRASWSGGRRNALSLALEPLPPADVATLVEHLVEGVSPEIVEEVVARADGNPFYAGEIVRALIEQVGAPLEPSAAHEALKRLPDTVQATLLARLDLLDGAERRMLQLGSVFGRSFGLPGIVALDESIADGVDDVADRLLDRDLVRPSGTRELAFRHILIREVAYGMLPRAERARLHARAAAWLAARAGGQEEAYAELVAVHAREAAALATALDLEEAPRLRREAVERLEAAATAAESAGANVEALRHLRAALEFATPDRHLDLYERMGDTTVHGDISIEALTHALELARSSGAPPQRELRILTGIVTFHTRWQGSVAGRPTEDELLGLFAEGRRLLEGVRDRPTRARFRAAEAFMPFWISAGPRSPNEAEIAAAEASAREAIALAIAEGDLSLQSAALDAVGGNAQLRGDYVAMSAAARQRLSFGDRLALFERIDAACMVAWAAVTVGDLDEAIAVCDDAARFVQPGQVTNWAMHLFAWRTLAGSLRGDWDPALAAAERARSCWNELERVAAGYATRGFLAAFEMARARRDDVGVTRWREVLDEIHGAFRNSNRSDLQHAIVINDPEAVIRLVEARESNSVGNETGERALSFLCDRRILPDGASIERMIERTFPQARMALAQLDRARGLRGHDPAFFIAALLTLRAAGARPGIGRVEVELGRLTGDAALVASGARFLQQVGDVEQLDRYGLTP